jgi:hypothetical protein
VSEFICVPAPGDWPADLPSPRSPDLPEAVIRWLWDAVPADRWRHEALAEEPWVLVMMATATVRRQIDDLRESWRDVRSYAKILGSVTTGRILAAHKAEAARLAELQTHLDQVGLELLHGPTKGGLRRGGK